MKSTGQLSDPFSHDPVIAALMYRQRQLRNWAAGIPADDVVAQLWLSTVRSSGSTVEVVRRLATLLRELVANNKAKIVELQQLVPLGDTEAEKAERASLLTMIGNHLHQAQFATALLEALASYDVLRD